MCRPFVHPGVATDPRIHKLKRKVLFMFQLWHDSFVLQQDRCPAIFSMYRKLRSKGVEFPQVDRSQKYLVKNAEESPAFDVAPPPPSVSSRSSRPSLESTKQETIAVEQMVYMLSLCLSPFVFFCLCYSLSHSLSPSVSLSL
ncbi:hypothetical protein, conserved [Eimeria praecox]|uniref:VHS domain-containing protein n=1 Tax=Eimeria praecox TaxID=51316 RepID=U6H093_9EIME|nr:hypothetical protein, conserved [Eimeria praecox]